MELLTLERAAEGSRRSRTSPPASQFETGTARAVQKGWGSPHKGGTESTEGKTRAVTGGSSTARTKTELQKLSEVVPLISSISHNAGANVTGMH